MTTEEVETIPPNAVLIAEGGKTYPLVKSAITIGRQLENQLVLDDRRVSRLHAHLRATKGRFVLFDLNSTGGTFVNGSRIKQTILYPHDVISFGGVELSYNQDEPITRTDMAATEP